MEIIESLTALHAARDQPVCVLARSAEDELAAATAQAWGLSLPEHPDPPRRPGVRLVDDEVDLVLLVLDEDRRQQPLRILATAQGVLILAEQPLHALVREPARDAEQLWEAVVGCLLAVARRCEESLDRIEDESQDIEDATSGYTSSPQRRTLGRLRADLFRIQETQAALHRLCTPDEEIAQTLPKALHRRLRRAATVFDANRSAASRLYAMIGDLLDEQAALVSERLTLVATIFLPLTLATGFFGMNFAWMQDGIGSFGAFLGLGIVLPALATVLTLVVVRRLTRSS